MGGEQFDFCDKDRHFETVVVQASSHHYVLLTGLLAVASRHYLLCNDSNNDTSIVVDPLASDRYQAECLRSFIPYISSGQDRPEGLDKGILCAVTLILRLHNEMTGM